MPSHGPPQVTDGCERRQTAPVGLRIRRLGVRVPPSAPRFGYCSEAWAKRAIVPVMPVLLSLWISSWVIGAGALVVDHVRPMLKRYQRGAIACYLILAAGGGVADLATTSGSQALNNLGFALQMVGLIGMLYSVAGARSWRRVRPRTRRD